MEQVLKIAHKTDDSGLWIITYVKRADGYFQKCEVLAIVYEPDLTHFDPIPQIKIKNQECKKKKMNYVNARNFTVLWLYIILLT